MNKNAQNKVLALVLCTFLGVMYYQSIWLPYFHPNPKDFSVGDTQLDSQSDSQQGYSSSVVDNVDASSFEIASKAKFFGSTPDVASMKQAGYVTISTDLYAATVSLLGGRISHFRLKGFKDSLDEGSSVLDMVIHEDDQIPYPLGVYVDDESDVDVIYALTSHSKRSTIKVPDGESAVLVLEGSLPDGRMIRKSLSMVSNTYLMDVAVKVSGGSPVSTIALEWIRSNEVTSKNKSPASIEDGYVWFNGDKAKRELFKDMDAPSRDLGQLLWGTLGDKYFMATLLTETPSSGLALSEPGTYSIRMTQLGADIKAKLFIGPKQYELLESLGHELQRNVNFGMTGFVAAPLLYLLKFFFGFFGNYGVAIVLLTIVVKGVTYPLSAFSFKQMKAMQELQPEITRIRNNVKDPQQQQQAIMALYKKRSVNPLGGCLPMVLQLPIFVGLFSALRLAIELRHAPFAFWINDLSAPERLDLFGLPVPVTVVLFVVSMLIQQWTMPSSMDQTQKKVMLVVPIVFGFMFAGMPAGLTLYFLVNNLISIGQQRSQMNSGAAMAMKVTAGVSISLFALALLLAKMG